MTVRTPGPDGGRRTKLWTRLFRGDELDMTVRVP